MISVRALAAMVNVEAANGQKSMMRAKYFYAFQTESSRWRRDKLVESMLVSHMPRLTEWKSGPKGFVG